MKPPTGIRKGCGKRLAKLRNPLIPDENGFGNVKCGEDNNYCPTCQALLEQAQEFEKMIEEFKSKLRNCDEFFNVRDYEDTVSTDKFMGIVELFLRDIFGDKELLKEVQGNSQQKSPSVDTSKTNGVFSDLSSSHSADNIQLVNYLHNKFKEEGKFIGKRFIKECIEEGYKKVQEETQKKVEELKDRFENKASKTAFVSEEIFEEIDKIFSKELLKEVQGEKE